LKIYIDADMEAIAGVSFFEPHAKTGSTEMYHFWERMRQLMTGEVKAAVQGALEAGADTIYINDNHHSGCNLPIEEFEPPVELLQGRGKRRPTFLPCLDDSFEAVLGVGCGYGMLGSDMSPMGHAVWEINDGALRLGRTGVLAVEAGCKGVPLIFMSGDQIGTEQIKELIPNIEVAVVKEGLGKWFARHLTPKGAQELIREGVRRAIERRHEFEPFRPNFPGPYKIGIAAYDESELQERVVEDDDLEMAMWKGQNALWAEFGRNEIDSYTYPIETGGGVSVTTGAGLSEKES
jgi:D-amino peptidase